LAASDVDCHAPLPGGHTTVGDDYHTWTCCAAGFQTGLCRLGVKSLHMPLMRATRSETGPKFNPLVHLREPPRCAAALSKKTGPLTAQSWDRVKGTKRTRVMERIRVSLGAIFSTTVSCCGASMDPSGMTSRPPTLSCSINGGGTCPSAAVTTIASKGPHSNHP